MEHDNSQRQNNVIFSKKVRAGRRRTYFIDVRPTRSNDYYLTITESKKRFDGDGYERHKIFLYKEDFNKFVDALTETVDHVKTELMPEYDFDEFNHSYEDRQSGDFAGSSAPAAPASEEVVTEQPEEEPMKMEDDPAPATEEEAPASAGQEESPSDEELKWD